MSHKFPENTVAGLYKRAVAENQYQDAVRFGAQKFNWTLREMDVSVYDLLQQCDNDDITNYFYTHFKKAI